MDVTFAKSNMLLYNMLPVILLPAVSNKVTMMFSITQWDIFNDSEKAGAYTQSL